MTHIEIAASKGMKAGYKARRRVLLNSGLPTAQAALADSFGDYCDKFGEAVTACQSQMRNKPRNARIVGVQVFADEPNTREDELATLRQRIAEIEAEQQAKAAKPKAKNDKPKVNVWHPWAIRKHNIPTKVGATFTYKGKLRTSTFKVTKVTKDGVESVRVA